MSEFHFSSHINFVIIVFYLIVIQKLKMKQRRIVSIAILLLALGAYSINRAQTSKLVSADARVGIVVVSVAFIFTTITSKSMGNIEEKLFMVIYNDCSKFKKICNCTSEAVLILQNGKVNFANDVWRNLKSMKPKGF